MTGPVSGAPATVMVDVDTRTLSHVDMDEPGPLAVSARSGAT
jgi:hypothetical protein